MAANVNNPYPQESPKAGIVGNREEVALFTEVYRHYVIANQDLTTRRQDWDKKDILFRSFIDETKWPYKAEVFDPRIFTALYEKTARELANKPRGRLIPREGGDALGAQIINELLDFQWDDNTRADGLPMLAKWALMSLTARKYGASFSLVKWHYKLQTHSNSKFKTPRAPFYDGPNFRPLNNRDCLPNPSYSTIKNWFQHRDYVTLDELEYVNDEARTKPVYKNLDILKQLLRNDSRTIVDTRASNYFVQNKRLMGLQDYLGRDEVYKTVEVITEYREDRWISFCPKHGVIIRDIPNPYDHGQIPVILLKYYPIDDDLYGLSEIEPIEKLQKATNALICQYLDAINMSLYPILKVRSTGGAVHMHTLEFGPGKKWLMANPESDVVAHQQGTAGVAEFTSTYRFLIGAIQSALGETSAGISNLVPGQADKTATEVRASTASTSARDNFNQLFLAEALKKQMLFWLKMNNQFLFNNVKGQQKVITITSKDAVKFFQNAGLDGYALDDEAINLLTQNSDLPPEEQVQIDPHELGKPFKSVMTATGEVPKFKMDENGNGGKLIIEPEDLDGDYEYIPDMQSMKIPDEISKQQQMNQLIGLLLNPVVSQLLAGEQYKLKLKEFLEDTMEQGGLKDADKYFEKIDQGGLNGQVNQGGGVGAQASGANQPNGINPGMAGSVASMVGNQAQPSVPGPNENNGIGPGGPMGL